MNLGTVTISRAIAILPVADPAGCIALDVGSGDGDCCDEGQDCPASECTQLSEECPDGLSTQFQFDDPDHPGNTVTLNWLCNPSDGNYSRFLSTGGEWSFAHLENPTLSGETFPGWVLTNLITGEVWVWPDSNGPICDLGIAGFEMLNHDGSSTVDMFAVNDCFESSYNCTASDCVGVAGLGGTYATIEACRTACVTTYNCVAGSCVAVVGAGGDFATLGECEAFCAGGAPGSACCPADTVPTTLKLTVSGTCGVTAINIVYNAAGAHGTGWYSTAQVCGGHSVVYRWYCDSSVPASPVWRLEAYCDGSLGGTAGPFTGACSPYSFTALGAFGGLCGTDIAPTVTVTS